MAHSPCFGLCNSMKPTYYFLIYRLVHGWAPQCPPTPSTKQCCKEPSWACSLGVYLGVEIAASELMHRLRFPGSARWLSGMVAPFNTRSCRERGLVCSRILDNYFTLFSNLQLSNLCQGNRQIALLSYIAF